MLTLDEIKKDPHTKQAFTYYINRMLHCYDGMKKAHDMITLGLETKEQKDIMWASYSQAFNDKVMDQMVGILEKNRCGLAESCLAVMKLLEAIGDFVENLELAHNNDDFWKGKFDA